MKKTFRHFSLTETTFGPPLYHVGLSNGLVIGAPDLQCVRRRRDLNSQLFDFESWTQPLHHRPLLYIIFTGLKDPLITADDIHFLSPNFQFRI